MVCYCLMKGIEGFAIQEHRICSKPDDPLRREQFGDSCYFIYSSADTRGVGGVGFLISGRV